MRDKPIIIVPVKDRDKKNKLDLQVPIELIIEWIRKKDRFEREDRERRRIFPNESVK
ncbi:MAG: hypothetical protein ACP5H8_00975 [Candidatus Micrarchaeia archaeon]